MKSRLTIFLGILCCLLFSACGKKETSTIEYEPVGNPAEIDFAASQNFWADPVGMQRGENGYYFMKVTGDLYYLDIEAGENIPLCNKPECTHETETCNASLGNQLGFTMADAFLRYCDGFLYVPYFADEEDGAGKIAIARVNPDGSGSERLVDLCEYSAAKRNDMQLMHFEVDRGFAYYTIINGMENGYRNFEIYSIELKKGAEPKLIDSSEEYDAPMWLGRQRIWDQKLYYSYYSADGNHMYSGLKCYSVGTGDIEVLLEDKNVVQMALVDQTLYCLVYLADGSEILALDLNTKEVREFSGEIDASGVYRISWDGKSFCAYNQEDSTISFFSKEEKLVGRIKVSDKYLTPDIIWGDSERLFVYDGSTLVSYYDKTLGEWKDIGE